jgi:hypothetical protein
MAAPTTLQSSAADANGSTSSNRATIAAAPDKFAAGSQVSPPLVHPFQRTLYCAAPPRIRLAQMAATSCSSSA